MSKSKRLQRRRQRLFEKDPHCYWCGQGLVQEAVSCGKLPDNFATIDHLRSRFNPDRREPQVSSDPPRTVLACRKCNQDRCRVEHYTIPLEELHKRSGRG